jgi:hypothetical protein
MKPDAWPQAPEPAVSSRELASPGRQPIRLGISTGRVS